jgi:hypothetical protein
VSGQLPAKGELIVVKWPGGPHNFLLKFDHEVPTAGLSKPDWLTLSGVVVEPAAQKGRLRTFYARQLSEREFTLVSAQSSAQG